MSIVVSALFAATVLTAGTNQPLKPDPAEVEARIWALAAAAPEKLARPLLEAREARAFESLDEAAQLERLLQLSAEIKQRIAAQTPPKPLRVQADASIESLDAQGRLRLMPGFFQDLVRVDMRTVSDHPLLPPHWLLLIANAPLMHAFELDEDAQARLAIAPDNWRRKRVRVEIELVPVEMAAGRTVHAVAQRADLLDSEGKVVVTQRERREFAEVIANRLLREGVSLTVDPNHTFSVFNLRLQEILVEHAPRDGQCREQGRLQGHRQVRCDFAIQAYGNRIDVAEVYVGGRGLSHELRCVPGQSLATSRVWSELSPAMGLGRNMPTEVTTVTRNHAHMRFDPIALNECDNKRAFFEARSTLLDALPPPSIIPGKTR